MPKRHSLWFLVPLGAAIGLAVAALKWTEPERKVELESPPPTRVVVTQVRRVDLRPRVAVTGRLRPARTAAVHFELAGRVVERHVEPGQAVAAGEPLLRLDPAERRDAVDRARARLEQERAAVARDRRLLELAEEDRALQEREVARQQRLGDDSLASRSQLEASQQRLLQLEGEEARLRYAVETTEARLTLLRTELREAERDLERTRLAAPFAGVVNTVDVQVGDYVTSSQRAVELVDTAHLELYAEVTGETAAALERGQAVSVTVADRAVEGRVVALQRDPDPETHTHALRIRIPGDDLLPGTLARADLPLRPRDGVRVAPVAALLREEGRTYLFRLTDGTVERVEVTPGLRYRGEVVLREGPGPGTTIVARDVAALADGQPVEAIDGRQPSGAEPGG